MAELSEVYGHNTKINGNNNVNKVYKQDFKEIGTLYTTILNLEPYGNQELITRYKYKLGTNLGTNKK